MKMWGKVGLALLSLIAGEIQGQLLMLQVKALVALHKVSRKLFYWTGARVKQIVIDYQKSVGL